MSSLRDYPPIINGVTLFRPEKWEVNPQTIDKVNMSEAGTDIVTVTRYAKVTISVEFLCDSLWLTQFKIWSREGSLNVKVYETEDRDYRERTMRIRNFKYNYEVHSDYITKSMGLYTVTFDLIQF